jgi:hypothetical protein
MKSIGIFSIIVSIIVLSSCTSRTIEDDIRDGVAEAHYIIENLSSGEITSIPYTGMETIPLLFYKRQDTIIVFQNIESSLLSQSYIIGFNSDKIIPRGADSWVYSDDSTYSEYYRGVIRDHSLRAK